MIRILSAVAILTLISGCTIHQSIGDSFGSAVRKPHGQNFQPEGPRWDAENNALLYVYRPNSQWASDEFEAPSFNVNSKRLFNIKGGSYTWYELKPGEYDIVMRRGLLGFEGFNDTVIKKVAEILLEVSAGKTYYLRYSEIAPPKEMEDYHGQFLGDGPLQLVSTELALNELPETKMLHRGKAKLDPKIKSKDQDLERVFDGQIETEDNVDGKAKGKTKTKEEWWPF